MPFNTDKKRKPTLRELAEDALSFIEGFVGDETQEDSVDDLADKLRAALEAKPEPDHDHSHDIEVRCQHCGSGDVRRDAWAEWDGTTQQWTLGDVFDAGFCGRCDCESTLTEWLPTEADAWDALEPDTREDDAEPTPEQNAIRDAANAAYRKRESDKYAAERKARRAK